MARVSKGVVGVASGLPSVVVLDVQMESSPDRKDPPAEPVRHQICSRQAQPLLLLPCPAKPGRLELQLQVLWLVCFLTSSCILSLPTDCSTAVPQYRSTSPHVWTQKATTVFFRRTARISPSSSYVSQINWSGQLAKGHPPAGPYVTPECNFFFFGLTVGVVAWVAVILRVPLARSAGM